MSPPATSPPIETSRPVLAVPRVGNAVDPSVTIPIYILIVTLGFFVFQGGRATLHGNEMSRQQSLFTAVNAATLTGFQQARAVSEYTPVGQATTFVMMLSGMMLSWVVGGTAVARIAKLPFTARHLLACGLLVIGATAGVGAVMGARCYGAAWPGVYQAVAVVGNCGLWIRRPPAGQSLQAMALLVPAVVGGLGLPVIMECLLGRWRGPRSAHFRTATVWSAGVYGVGAVALAMTLWCAGGASWPDGWIVAAREAMNARSAGLSFQSAGDWPRATQWVVIGLMLVGASPGGAGGGIKVTTLAVITAGVRDALGRRAPGRLFGVAALWAGGYLLLVLAGLLVLLSTEPQISADRLLFLAASAMGNVGLSHDPVVVSSAGLYTLSVMMLAGRVLPLLVLWTIADEAVEQERVAVG